MVVEAVLQNWILLVAEGEAGPERWGQEIQRQDAFFYTDDQLFASTHTEWTQGEFNRLVLWANVGKTVGMICQPRRSVGKHSDMEYGQHMTVEGMTYRSYQKQRV